MRPEGRRASRDVSSVAPLGVELQWGWSAHQQVHHHVYLLQYEISSREAGGGGDEAEGGSPSGQTATHCLW